MKFLTTSLSFIVFWFGTVAVAQNIPIPSGPPSPIGGIGPATTMQLGLVKCDPLGTTVCAPDGTMTAPGGGGGGINQLTGGVTAGPGTGSQVATVVTNANLTGPVTSVGNATAFATMTANAFLTGNGTALPNRVAITGLVKGNGASAPGAYAGTSCTNQFPRSLDLNGAATCASVANADLANSSVTIAGHSVSLGGTQTLASTDLSDSSGLARLATAESFTKAQRGTPSNIAISTATFTPNFDNAQNFEVDLTSACPCTLANPSTSLVAGQSGMIEVHQDGSGSRTIGTWDSDYQYVGGTSTITLSTAANAVDYLPYYVNNAATGIVLGTLIKAPAH